LVVGAGGLGSPVLAALAAAGVGTLGVIDHDVVDLSNLHRQLLYGEADLGRAKVESAQSALERQSPRTCVLAYRRRLDAASVQELGPQFDIIVDGSDNFATKFLVNDACVLASRPFVIGGAVRWSGQLLAWAPGSDAGCYRCLFEGPPPADAVPSCQQAGVMGAVCGVVGGLQAKAVLALLGHPDGGAPLPGQIYLYEALSASLRAVPCRKNRECAVCGPRATIDRLDASNYAMKECSS
jgi:adenylyltransferase/sulfurtransferase